MFAWGNCPDPVESIHWSISGQSHMSLPTIFSTCRPRADVLAGTIRDDEFMADLSRVVNKTAPEDYLNPAAFFAKSYPTRGIKELLKAICLRLSGKGGEVSSIIRLGTQYGGGKTHGLIALVHAVRGAKGVQNLSAFVDPSILPSGNVRIAALDGENADPANGLTLEPGLLARSLWGEMAYRLAGRRVRAYSAERRKAYRAGGGDNSGTLWWPAHAHPAGRSFRLPAQGGAGFSRRLEAIRRFHSRPV